MPRLSAQERKGKIIETAIALFSEKGFRGTTTHEIAKRAGISEALLFRHFPDKRRLYQAILSAKMEEQIPLLFRDLPLDGEPRTILLDLGRRIVLQNEKDPSFLRLLLFSALEGHELSDLFFQSRTLPLLEFLKKFLVAGKNEGRFHFSDSETAARAFLGMIFGLVQTRILFRIRRVVRRPLRRILETYIDIYLKGISS